MRSVIVVSTKKIKIKTSMDEEWSETTRTATKHAYAQKPVLQIFALSQATPKKQKVRTYVEKVLRNKIALFIILSFATEQPEIYINQKILRFIYFTEFDSYLSYASIIWAQSSNAIQQFIILQKNSYQGKII